MADAAEKKQPETEGQEPSMEEILASIRRIISDDDAEATPPQKAEEKPAEPKAQEPAPVEEPVIEEPVAEEPVIELTDDIAPDEPNSIPEEEVLELTELVEEPLMQEPELVSETAKESSVSSLSSLYHVALKAAHPMGNANKTIEDIVKECLKPMLKEWLDTNLPGMVEKIVSTEIERLIRRAG